MSPFVYRLSKLLTQLASPLPLALLVLVVAFVLLARDRTRAARRWLAAGIAALWIASLPVVSFHAIRSLEAPFPPVPVADVPQADAIVLLGGAVAPPHPPLHWMDLNDAVDRIFHAARLLRAGKAPFLVVSGGGGPYTGGPQTPADSMADVLVELGVPRDALVLETRSRSTAENARFSKPLLEARGARRVLVVTSAAHMRRSLAVFRSLGFEAIPAATDYATGLIDYGLPSVWIPDAGCLRGTTSALKEYAGIFVYWLRGEIRLDAL
jgi:uncharacterized SAM-binding protein YcdF (DUF218 family)